MRNKITGITSLQHAIMYFEGMNFHWTKIIINKKTIYKKDIISSKKKENCIFYRGRKKVAELKNGTLFWE
jgi:hypothetical protein